MKSRMQYCQIIIMCLLFLFTDAANEIEFEDFSLDLNMCQLTEEILNNRHINMVANELDMNFEVNFTQNFVCQDGYTTLVVDDLYSISADLHIDHIPTYLQAKCIEDASNESILVFEPIPSDCADMICDEICKKFYTKEDLASYAIHMNIQYKQLPTNLSYFWPGMIIDAECQQSFYLKVSEENQKGTYSYSSGSDLEIELNECFNNASCDPNLNDPYWIAKNKCVRPECDVVYAENMLNMILEKTEESIVINNTYQFKCQSSSAKLKCAFDNIRNLSYWADLESHISELICKASCHLNADMEETLAQNNYQLANEEDKGKSVLSGYNITLRCLPGYIHQGDNKKEIHAPFLATCISDYKIHTKENCQNGKCSLPPDQHIFHVKPVYRTGLAECLIGYGQNDTIHKTRIYLICYNNQWKIAKENGRILNCSRTYILQPCKAYKDMHSTYEKIFVPNSKNKVISFGPYVDEDTSVFNVSQLNIMDFGASIFPNDMQIKVKCPLGTSIFNELPVAIIKCINTRWFIGEKLISGNPCQKAICNYPNADEFHVMATSNMTGNFVCDKNYAPRHGKISMRIKLICHLGQWMHASYDDKCYKKCMETSALRLPRHIVEVRHGELVTVTCVMKNMSLVGGSLARCHDGKLMHVTDPLQEMALDTEAKVCQPVPQIQNCVHLEQDCSFFSHVETFIIIGFWILFFVLFVSMSIILYLSHFGRYINVYKTYTSTELAKSKSEMTEKAGKKQSKEDLLKEK